MIKVVAVLVALVALLGEARVRSLPKHIKRAIAMALEVPAEHVSVKVKAGASEVTEIALRTEGGRVPLELLKRLRPTGRRPDFPVRVGKFTWEARGLRWGEVRIAELTVRLKGVELDGAKLARGKLRVGRLGEGSIEVLLTPGDLVRAMAKAGAPVSRVRFEEGAISVWLGPGGVGVLFVKVRPHAKAGKISFQVVEAKAGLVPLPRKVAQAVLDRAFSGLLKSLSIFGRLKGLGVKIGPEGLRLIGKLSPRVGRNLEPGGGVMLQ